MAINLDLIITAVILKEGLQGLVAGNRNPLMSHRPEDITAGDEKHLAGRKYLPGIIVGNVDTPSIPGGVCPG